MTNISARLEGGMAVKLTNGRHEWTADEPASAGGTDTGPNPYELLLGSLAACTCITIAWYCQRKELPLQSVSASYELTRIHAKDCEDCEMPERGYIEKITSNVEIEGDFSDAQKERLAQIVERCPVHKTLGHGMQFEDNARFLAPD